MFSNFGSSTRQNNDNNRASQDTYKLVVYKLDAQDMHVPGICVPRIAKETKVLARLEQQEVRQWWTRHSRTHD